MKTWVIILIVVALAVISYFVYKSVQAKQKAAAETAQLNAILQANQNGINIAGHTSYGILGEVSSSAGSLISSLTPALSGGGLSSLLALL